MKALLWIGGAVAAIVLLLAVRTANMPPEVAAAYAQVDRVKEFCDAAISDSAPGSDRRTSRAICDQMKAKARAELDAARQRNR